MRLNHSSTDGPLDWARGKRGGRAVELGQARGWSREECAQGVQPEPKGTIPTTAAKLCQPRPRRNIQEGREPEGNGEVAASGREEVEAEGHLGQAAGSKSRQDGHLAQERGLATARRHRPGCPGDISYLQPHGHHRHQWAGESLSSPQDPHLLASRVAPIGQVVSSGESRAVRQALETEWGKCITCV